MGEESKYKSVDKSNPLSTLRLEEWQNMLNSLRDGVFIVFDGEVVFANNQVEQIIGISPSELTLDTLFNVLERTPNVTAKGNLQRLLTYKSFGPIQFDILGFQNKIRSIEFTCRTIPLGERQAMQCIISDITREYAIESELFDTLTLLNSVFDAIDEAIFIINENDFTLRSSNEATEKIFRVDRASIKGKNLWRFLAAPLYRDEIEKQIKERLPKTGRLFFDIDMRRGDGTIFPAFHSIIEIHNSAGDKIGIMWIISDMSQQAYLNRALSETETRYRILFERNADPTFVIDAATRSIVDLNDAASSHLGYTRGELLGKSALQITPEGRQEKMTHDLDELMKNGSASFNGVNLTGQGLEIPVNINAVTATYSGRKAFIVSCRDISTQIEMERERMRLERLEAARQVTGGIAHEFSQPLQGLITISELLENPDTILENKIELMRRIPPLVERMSILLAQMKGLVRFAVKSYTSSDNILDFDKSAQMSRLLIVDINNTFAEAAERVARARGLKPTIKTELSEALKELESGEYNIVITDNFASCADVQELCNVIREKWPDIIVINTDAENKQATLISESKLLQNLDTALGESNLNLQ